MVYISTFVCIKVYAVLLFMIFIVTSLLYDILLTLIKLYDLSIIFNWCDWPDSNRHAFLRQILSLLSIPFLHSRILAGPERFELPTAGFEDQNSSTELRTDGIFDGPAARNRTWINSLEGYCTVHCATARYICYCSSSLRNCCSIHNIF